jgi:dolichol-phosphate mannosyltransferase
MGEKQEKRMIIDNSWGGRLPLLAIGVLAISLDSAVFNDFHVSATTLGLAQIVGFFSALALSLPLLALIDKGMRIRRPAHLSTIAVIALLVLFLRGGLLASLVQILGVPVTVAHLVTALFSVLALYAGYLWFVEPQRAQGRSDATRWDLFCLVAAGYAVLLRLLYLGVPELLFEEAYYWNYARHLAIGYLDHPLMVAWIMRPFIDLMGNTELAVRSGAFLCWLATASFSYRLTRDVLDRAAAYRALMLVAVLPIYFSFGLFMTPDAPVTACWAAAIYFMQQIVVRGKSRAWLGLGIAIGLGMISKYTIALLAAAIVLFVLFDRPSRKWLSRPEPYMAALVALALFLPAVIWNWQHDWISFSFQSQDRLASKFSFSLPRLIGNIIVILTPTGIVSVAALLIYRQQAWAGFSDRFASHTAATGAWLRSALLLTWLALFPLAVFAAVSLFRASKLNWTGPAWLALLPLMALLVTPGPAAGLPKLLTWCRQAWPPTIVICLLLYGAALHWLSLGLPGVAYPNNMHLIGWRDFARDVELLVQQSRRETGREILVVGMDRNRIASGLAFYRSQYLDAAGGNAGHDPAFETASEHLFGSVGLMYALWFPDSQQNGKTMLLVAKDASSLGTVQVLSRVKTAGEIKEIDVRQQGKPAGRYYARLVTGYQAKGVAAGAAVDGKPDE